MVSWAGRGASTGGAKAAGGGWNAEISGVDGRSSMVEELKSAIGIVGGLAGLGVAYVIVKNINEIHTWMGEMMGLKIWDPEVYAFDVIPSSMDPKTVIIIVGVAIVSSVLGALLPAIRAARMNPVEALRWE